MLIHTGKGSLLTSPYSIYIQGTAGSDVTMHGMLRNLINTTGLQALSELVHDHLSEVLCSFSFKGLIGIPEKVLNFEF